MKKRLCRIITCLLALALCFSSCFVLISCEKKQNGDPAATNGIDESPNAESAREEYAKNEARYKAFAEKVREYEEKYGEGKYVTVDEYFRYTAGLAFIKLVDFKGNGTKDLLLAYNTNPDEIVESGYADYKFEIWGFENEKAVLLDEGGLFGSDGGVTNVLLNKRDDKWYLITGSADSFGDFSYHGYSEKGFGIIQTIAYDEFGDGDVGLIDGKEVPMNEVNKEIDAWGESEYSKNFMFDGREILKANQTTKNQLQGKV